MSTRREGHFVAVNVTAVPTSMFEREFFGHRRGAFSGADNDCEGYAAEANGGTLFLDEIGDMAKETQAKLLRLLQDGSYTVLGDPDEKRTDLRVVAATNKDLEQAVLDGKFREDLYYRLRILEINIPPLRKHTEDVIPLLEHFLSQSAGRRVAATDYFNRTSLNLLEHYPWPGNAREVSMVARRAHISMKIDGKVLVELGTGRDALVLSGPGKEAAAAAEAGTAEDAKDLTRARLVLALEEAGGNRTEAARLLGISRGALYRRLERFGLE
jgi:DNA-binding NtrC family response regulator